MCGLREKLRSWARTQRHRISAGHRRACADSSFPSILHCPWISAGIGASACRTWLGVGVAQPAVGASAARDLMRLLPLSAAPPAAPEGRCIQLNRAVACAPRVSTVLQSHPTAQSRPSLSTQPSQGLRLHREQSGTCPALKRLLRARLIGSSAFAGCRQRTCKLALGISSRRDQTLRTRLPAHKQRTNKLRCAPRRLKTVPVQGRRWRRRCCRHPCAP